MFCTECGTQIEQGKKFCRNCGARVGAAVEPRTAAPTGSGEDSQRSAQPIPGETPQENGGNNRLLVVAAGIAVLVLGGAGVYFGSDLFRPTAPSVSEPVAKNTEAPPLPSFEETRDAGSVTDNSPTSSNPPQSPNPEPPTPGERPKLPLETLPKAEAPAPAGRSNRPPPSTPISRGGATAGIYETMRTTTVYEDPSPSSKVLASIAAGTRVTVVGSNGDWLEVHSRRGNPPGFIRRGDATFVEKSN